jgi:hypothetical protein
MKIILLVLSIFSVVVMPISANEEKRINVSDVNIRNYEKFIEQIKNDLPAGTSIQQVKDYLSEKGVEYGHATVEGCIKFMIKKVDSSFFFFKTDLQIKVFASEESGVSEIKSSLIETAF